MFGISPWVFTAVAVIVTAAAHVMFKLFAIHGRWWRLCVTAGLFLCAPALTFIALQDLSFAQVYLCTAAVPVLGLVAARWVFGETIHGSHLAGTALIATGIVLYQTAALNG